MQIYILKDQSCPQGGAGLLKQGKLLKEQFMVGHGPCARGLGGRY